VLCLHGRVYSRTRVVLACVRSEAYHSLATTPPPPYPPHPLGRTIPPCRAHTTNSLLTSAEKVPIPSLTPRHTSPHLTTPDCTLVEPVLGSLHLPPIITPRLNRGRRTKSAAVPCQAVRPPVPTILSASFHALSTFIASLLTVFPHTLAVWHAVAKGKARTGVADALEKELFEMVLDVFEVRWIAEPVILLLLLPLITTMRRARLALWLVAGAQFFGQTRAVPCGGGRCRPVLGRAVRTAPRTQPHALLADARRLFSIGTPGRSEGVGKKRASREC
jgi:hypothetical protein